MRNAVATRLLRLAERGASFLRAAASFVATPSAVSIEIGWVLDRVLQPWRRDLPTIQRKPNIISAFARILSLSAFTFVCFGAISPAAADQAFLTYNASFQGVAIITDLTASSGPAAGYITLTWTAPGNNGTTLPLAYDLHVSTVANMNNNVQFGSGLAMSAFSTATVPAPLSAGSAQSFVIGGLTPGVTYYFALREFDSSTPTATGAWTRNLAKGWNVNNFAVPFASAPFTVQGLTGVSGFKSAILCWQDLTPAQKGTTFQDYDLYKSTVFPPSFNSIALTTSTCYTDTAVLVGSTYYYMVTGKFSNFETAASSTVSVWVHSGPPLPPVGVGITVTSTSTAKLTWFPVYAYANGVSFAVSTAPTTDELTSYQVYRASAPILAQWTQIATVSSATLSWSDPSAPNPAYYYISAANLTDASRPSVVRSMPDRTAYVIMPDGYSTLSIPAAAADAALGVGAANTAGAYDIYASSRSQDIPGIPSQQVGKTVESVELDYLQGGSKLNSPIATLGAMATLSLHYGLSSDGSQITASAIAPAGGARAAGVSATPGSIAIYWFNGSKWMQMYGTVDSVGQYVRLQTIYLGRYQLRAVERTGGFNVDVSGLSNRLLTPNGDAKNDNVVIVFDNPKDSSVSGKIYDLKGKFVANMTQGPIANSLMWDGKSNGVVVPGGVYIYQITAEGRTFNGTIVVVK